MITGIDHIAIAVENLEEASRTFSAIVGCDPASVVIEEVPSEQVRVAFIPLGPTKIELLEPTAPDSPVGRFLQKNGGGMHHIALATGNIEEESARAAANGIDPLGEIRHGAGGKRIIFLNPKQTGRVLLEFTQHGHS